MIEESLYTEIISNVPLPCVDVIVRYRDKYLLVKRKEEPEQGEFWVPGGRVLRGERLDAAVRRKLLSEICPWEEAFEWDTLRMVGVYEDVWETGGKVPGYHTVANVFEIVIRDLGGIKLDDTSADWGLFTRLPARFKVQRFA